MVLEADRNGCLPEVLVIAAALSIQDPRERPPDHQQAADEKHRRFADDRSDFLAYRNLWLYLQEQQKALSGSAFRRLCRTEFLHYLRIREWQDLVGQLRQVAKSLGISTTGELSQPGDDPQPVHTALLPGLLSHVGLWDPDKREYAGARGARFAPWPGSALFKKPPRWVMAGELVETSRLWGRDLGRVEPEWVEPLAEHLVKRTYSEPHWSAKQRRRDGRRAGHALRRPARRAAARSPTAGSTRRSRASCSSGTRWCGGEWRTHHEFFHANRDAARGRRGARAPGPAARHPGRRRDAGRVLRRAAAGRRRVRRGTSTPGGRRPAATSRTCSPSTRRCWCATTPTGSASSDYPDIWRQGDVELPLSYQFEPGTDADGVTVHVPLSVLNRLTTDGFDWQVPGPAGRPRGRAAAVAAQGAAAQLRARTGHARRRRCGRSARTCGPSRSPTRWPASCGRPPA